MMAWAILGGLVLIAGLLGTILLTRARRKAARRPESATTLESRPASRVTVTATPGGSAESGDAVQSLSQQVGGASIAVDAEKRSDADEEAHRISEESRVAAEAEQRHEFWPAETEARHVIEEALTGTEANAPQIAEVLRAAPEAEKSRAANQAGIPAEAGTQRDFEESVFAEEEVARSPEESTATADGEPVLEESRGASDAGSPFTANDATASVETGARSSAEASRVPMESEAPNEADEPQPVPAAENELATGDANRHHEEHPSLNALDDHDDATLATVDEQDDAADPASADGGLHTTVRNSPRRRPPTYRPPTSGPSIPGQRSSSVAMLSPNDGTRFARRASSVALRLTFERGGFWNVRLLPTRPENLPERCSVRTGGGSIELLARDEEWYQDVEVDAMGTLLRSGFVWTEVDSGQEWVFAAGREILVLATGTVHIGFVSTGRLALGRQHAVLCTTSHLAAVEHALRQADCGEWKQFDETDGVPKGWVVLCGLDDGGRARGLVPERAVPQEGDALDVLRPLPDVEISLEGGVPLGYNSWLAGVPPAIRVYGSPDFTRKVLIDAKEATLEDGAYVVAGWDEVGEHQVWCHNVRRSYSLVQVQQRAKSWAEFSFMASDKRGRIAICGPLVRPVGDASQLEEPTEPRHRFAVLASNPVLLGPTPGDVLLAVPPRGIHAQTFLAYPSFAPIWALPVHPLRSSRGVTRVLFVGDSTVPSSPGPPRQSERHTNRAIEQWWQMIRDARKKGLAVEPKHPDVVALWRRYTDLADSLWKTNR